jgi:hypothetical protein
MHIKAARKRLFAGSLIVLLSCSNNVADQEEDCTDSEALAAEQGTSRLKNWTDIYNSFRRFGHCDDGSIAEGYSDSVVRTLASRWHQLGTLDKLSSCDSEFRSFVLRHIDATTDDRDIKKLIANASKRCPAKAKTLCSEIEKQGRSVLRELGQRR